MSELAIKTFLGKKLMKNLHLSLPLIYLRFSHVFSCRYYYSVRNTIVIHTIVIVTRKEKRPEKNVNKSKLMEGGNYNVE